MRHPIVQRLALPLRAPLTRLLPAASAAAAPPRRWLSYSSLRFYPAFSGWDREDPRADERLQRKDSQLERDFVNREERESIRNLLTKLDSIDDPDSSRAQRRLHDIMEKHGYQLPDHVIHDLLEWKASGH